MEPEKLEDVKAYVSSSLCGSRASFNFEQRTPSDIAPHRRFHAAAGEGRDNEEPRAGHQNGGI
jgi:hypothetical protein